MKRLSAASDHDQQERPTMRGAGQSGRHRSTSTITGYLMGNLRTGNKRHNRAMAALQAVKTAAAKAAALVKNKPAKAAA
jgi:hypothetical protein